MESPNMVFIRECENCKNEFNERNSTHNICDLCIEKDQIQLLPDYLKTSLKDNKNFSLIGPAGCGKSFYIKLMALWLKHNEKLFDILCPTGSSAINVNGITYHSVFGYRPLGVSGLFFNINIANILNLPPEELHKKLKNPRYRSCYNRIQQLDCIIFDEFSMIQHTHVDCMNRICKIIKSSYDKVFGGIQVIFVGDPFQMRPVMGDYPFNSACWESLGLITHEIVSERLPRFNDPFFSDITRMIRLGLISSHITKNFEEQTKDPPHKIIELYYTNRDVHDSNISEYNKINTQEHTYPSELNIWYIINDIGTRISIKNDKICSNECSLDFNSTPEDQLRIINETHGDLIKNFIDRNRQEFIKNLTNIYGDNYMSLKFKKDTRIICTINSKLSEETKSSNSGNEYLYVNGSTGIIKECLENGIRVILDTSNEIIVEYKNIEFTRRLKITDTLYIDITLRFNHIPLRLGYSFSYNRSQGTTLETVLISGKGLRKTSGIVYVGISRCKTFENMYIKDFSFDKLQVSNSAVEKFRDHYIREVYWLWSRHPEWFDEYYLNTDNDFRSQQIYGIVESIKSGTDIQRIIDSRGSSQGSIRKWLLEHQKCCCITGESIPELLEACHIIPYSELRNTTEAHNGNTILLRVDLHKLFDKFLMSIKSDGSIVWHDKLRNHQLYSKFTKSKIPQFINPENLDIQYKKYLEINIL